MALHTPHRAASIAALPTFSEAAELIGIDASGISRAVKRLEIEPIRWGNREKRLTVADLLTIAQGAHRHSLEEVGGELLDRTERKHPEQAAMIRAEIDEFFAALPKPAPLSEDEFVEMVKATLPPEMAARHIALYRSQRRNSQ